MKITVAGTGYVGLSISMLLAQYNEVHALDIAPEKIEKLNRFESPIKDVDIERFLAEAKVGKRALDFHATIDPSEAYTGAEFVVIATPTNYDSDKNYFDTSSIEADVYKRQAVRFPPPGSGSRAGPSAASRSSRRAACTSGRG